MSNLTLQPRGILGNVVQIAGTPIFAGTAAASYIAFLTGEGQASYILGGASVPLYLAQGLLVAAATAVGGILKTALMNSNAIRLPAFMQGVEEYTLGPLLSGATLALVNMQASGDFAPNTLRDGIFGALANLVGEKTTMFVRQTFPNTFM